MPDRAALSCVTLWRYPDDGVRMLVQLNDAADHPAIIVKIAVPIRVGEDNIRSAARTMLVRRMNAPA
jgi:hypothetical protein